MKLYENEKFFYDILKNISRDKDDDKLRPEDLSDFYDIDGSDEIDSLGKSFEDV